MVLSAVLELAQVGCIAFLESAIREAEALSAGIAFSLPYIVSVTARSFWITWSIIERETIYLISVEIVTAIMLLLVFSYLGRSLKDRRIARTAKYAGLVHCFRGAGLLAQRRIKKLKNKQEYYYGRKHTF